LVSTTRGAEGDHLDQSEELTEAQRFYQARWAAWGLYKTEIWQLTPDVLEQVGESLADWATSIFQALQVTDRSQVLRDFYPGGEN
jgi:hypothetical protein